jgi:hypothetical protein
VSYYLKDPQSRVDYSIDWTGYLDGQAIESSSWSIVPEESGGLTVDEQSRDLVRTAATIAGGQTGRVYSVSNKVILSDGRSDERSITLRVEQR